MLLVLVELGINHVCSTRNILVGVRPTVLVLIERMLLELRLGGGLKVLPELEPARVELANGGRAGVETTEHLQDRQGGLHVGTYLLVPRNQ